MRYWNSTYPKYLSQDVDVTWHPKASASILKDDNINSGVSEIKEGCLRFIIDKDKYL